jgi:stress response protein YsnF
LKRTPVDRPATEEDIENFKEGTVEVREMSEEAVVGKKARVVEEVSLGKQVSERTEKVSDTVRRTDVEVERLEKATAKDSADIKKPRR